MPLHPGPQPGAQHAVGEWEVPAEQTRMGLEGFHGGDLWQLTMK